MSGGRAWASGHAPGQQSRLIGYLYRRVRGESTARRNWEIPNNHSQKRSFQGWSSGYVSAYSFMTRVFSGAPGVTGTRLARQSREQREPGRDSWRRKGQQRPGRTAGPALGGPRGLRRGGARPGRGVVARSSLPTCGPCEPRRHSSRSRRLPGLADLVPCPVRESGTGQLPRSRARWWCHTRHTWARDPSHAERPYDIPRSRAEQTRGLLEGPS